MGMTAYAFLWYGSKPVPRRLSYEERTLLKQKLRPQGLTLVYITYPDDSPLCAVGVLSTYQCTEWSVVEKVMPREATPNEDATLRVAMRELEMGHEIGWWQAATLEL